MPYLIFFSGLVIGFFLGWLNLALLTIATVKNQKAQSPAGLSYCRISPEQNGSRGCYPDE